MKLNDKVKAYLETIPSTRDNDQELISRIWASELRKEGFELREGSIADFLNLHAKGRLSSSESIRRSRQKLQQDNPSLRGARYQERQSEQQKETQQELGYG